MNRSEARRRFGETRVARLATIRPDGAPHIVPVTFALVGEHVYTAVDHKPKAGGRLQRLDNLRHDPRCVLLVDHYDDDWSRLWWVRADGRARIIDHTAREHAGMSALVARYPQYRAHRPAGPLIEVRIDRWRWWHG